MFKPKVAYAQLRDRLLELGFQERVVAEGHLSFRHATSDTTILLPRYEAEELVPRRMEALVEKGEAIGALGAFGHAFRSENLNRYYLSLDDRRGTATAYRTRR